MKNLAQWGGIPILSSVFYLIAAYYLSMTYFGFSVFMTISFGLIPTLIIFLWKAKTLKGSLKDKLIDRSPPYLSRLTSIPLIKDV